MLDRAIKYLRAHNVDFRLFSYSTPEPLPEVAHPLRPREGSKLIDVYIILIGDRPSIACTPRGSWVSLPALCNELKAVVVYGSVADLPPPFNQASEPIPPPGKLINVPILFDESIGMSAVIAFFAFSTVDIIEIPYDEFSRIEAPHTSKFAFGGELPPEQEIKDDRESGAPAGQGRPTP